MINYVKNDSKELLAKNKINKEIRVIVDIPMLLTLNNANYYFFFTIVNGSIVFGPNFQNRTFTDLDVLRSPQSKMS